MSMSVCEIVILIGCALKEEFTAISIIIWSDLKKNLERNSEKI